MSVGVERLRIVVVGEASPPLTAVLSRLSELDRGPIEVIRCGGLSALQDAGDGVDVVLIDETADAAFAAGELTGARDSEGTSVRAVLVGPEPTASARVAFEELLVDRLIGAGGGGDRMLAELGALMDRACALGRLREALAGRIGRHLFVTGGNGFVGARLIREVLQCSDVRVTALIRSESGCGLAERLPFDASVFGDRLELVDGEITKVDLGLPAETVERLRASVDEVWHLAAVTDFGEQAKDRVMEANVEGTGEVLRFSEGLSNLRAFNYVSTAYVAGMRSDPEVAFEQLESPPPEFRNPYEESKYLAEGLVARSGLPYLIYRPSVVFGESYSGRGDGKTVYGVAQVFRFAKLMSDRERGRGNGLGTVFRVRARQSALLNLIPVDWVVDRMLRVRAATEPDGRVFHITHDRPVSMEEMHDVIMPLCGIERCEVDPALPIAGLHPSERFIYRKLAAFRPYMMESDPRFDRSNVEAVLGVESTRRFDQAALYFALEAFLQQEGLSAAPRCVQRTQGTPASQSG